METRRPEVENRKNGEAGYTLLEVLISITIFMVGILAIGSMQAAALRTNSTAMGVTEAVNIGQANVERILAIPFDPTAPDAALNPANNGASAHRDTFVSGLGERYDIEWTTTYLDLNSDGDNDALDIDLTVEWGDLYGQRSVGFNFRKTTRF